MRFCQSFMTGAKYIGPSLDVPAGDIGLVDVDWLPL